MKPKESKEHARSVKIDKILTGKYTAIPAFVGIMALVFLGVYIHIFKKYAWMSAFLISGCVGLSLIVAMVVSSLVGTIIPMFFHKIHIDPAVASGPLITTVNDLVAVVTYYGLAMIFLVEIFHV